MDILSGSDKPLTDLGAIREGIKAVNPEFRDQVALLLDHSATDRRRPDDHGQPPAAAFRAAVEEWFSQTMDRVSGWYKRDAQTNALLLAACVTLVVNADTLHIVQRLWQDPALRAAAVEGAQNRTQTAKTEDLLPVAEYTDTNDPSTSAPVRVIDTQLSEKEQALLGQLAGWDADWKQLGEMRAQGKTSTWFGNLLWTHLLGWVLTAFAVSQGAPFWFDTLNKFMNVRNAGRAPAERRTKAETDGKSS